MSASGKVALGSLLIFVAATAIFGSARAAIQSSSTNQRALVKPLVAAHRGFPALIPEETIAGYQAAIQAGTDFIEMDLVATKDGVLVLRHDLTLDDSTDIASHAEFSGRKKTLSLPFDGGNTTGFYIADFTLTELRTLYMTQAFAWRDASKNYNSRIVTFDEILAFAAEVYEEDRPVGLYVETKGVEYHDRIGLGLEEKLVQSIARSGLANVSDSAIILQSFEPLALVKMHRLQVQYGLKPSPLVYLLNSNSTCQPNVTNADLDAFQNGYNLPNDLLFLGPSKDSLLEYVYDPACNRPNTTSCGQQANQTCTGRLSPRYAAALSGNSSVPDSLIQVAHKRGMGVHPYTFRNEGRYMALDFNNDIGRELDFFFKMEVDGFFIDNPQSATRWWESVSNEPYAENALAPRYN